MAAHKHEKADLLQQLRAATRDGARASEDAVRKAVREALRDASHRHVTQVRALKVAHEAELESQRRSHKATIESMAAELRSLRTTVHDHHSRMLGSPSSSSLGSTVRARGLATPHGSPSPRSLYGSSMPPRTPTPVEGQPSVPRPSSGIVSPGDSDGGDHTGGSDGTPTAASSIPPSPANSETAKTRASVARMYSHLDNVRREAARAGSGSAAGTDSGDSRSTSAVAAVMRAHARRLPVSSGYGSPTNHTTNTGDGGRGAVHAADATDAPAPGPQRRRRSLRGRGQHTIDLVELANADVHGEVVAQLASQQQQQQHDDQQDTWPSAGVEDAAASGGAMTLAALASSSSYDVTDDGRYGVAAQESAGGGGGGGTPIHAAPHLASPASQPPTPTPASAVPTPLPRGSDHVDVATPRQEAELLA